MSDLDYLESERKKLWSKVLELEKELEKKTSDYENEAKQSSRKCSEYKNKCEAAKNEIQNILADISSIHNKIDESLVLKQINSIKQFDASIEAKKTALDSKVISLENLFEDFEQISEKLTNLQSMASSAEDSEAKIDAALDQLTARKKELDQFYYEIFGSVKVDVASGNETKIIGRKEELSKVYDGLKSSFDNFKKDEVDKKFSAWADRYNALELKIESLLPKALTAGLSHAHFEKKNAEIQERASYAKTFQFWVFILIAISLIPFGVSVYLLKNGTTLLEMLELLPRLVFSILPLYIPPLWVAISASRKMNLSKRLIEEYTHKEVIAKTYEGLSKQIEDIKDKKTAEELKAKLLFNILQVSTENPGHLISDYNKSDHPILERLNNLVGKNPDVPKKTEAA